MDFGRYTASLRVTGIYDHNEVCLLVKLFLMLDNEHFVGCSWLLFCASTIDQ